MSKKRKRVAKSKIFAHIDHNHDEHTMELQRSKYIKVDDDYKCFFFQHGQGAGKCGGDEDDDIVMKLKFCKSSAVDKKF